MKGTVHKRGREGAGSVTPSLYRTTFSKRRAPKRKGKRPEKGKPKTLSQQGECRGGRYNVRRQEGERGDLLSGDGPSEENYESSDTAIKRRSQGGRGPKLNHEVSGERVAGRKKTNCLGVLRGRGGTFVLVNLKGADVMGGQDKTPSNKNDILHCPCTKTPVKRSTIQD